ncbi:UGGG-like protein [Mya arenaria]|uniref:UGGG-like protein n=1 Tax=Mya arenaria TaxID=6604 RepID=A0ABY7G9C3_MYAAR|nr:UGGG-like protein [Mya arenaria]
MKEETERRAALKGKTTECANGLHDESCLAMCQFALPGIVNRRGLQVCVQTDEAMYHLIQKFSAKFLTPMLQNFLKMFLSLRAYSPTVEMFQHMADDAGPPDGCDAFVFVHGEKTCDADKIKGLVKSAANKDGPVLFKFDHVYPGGRDAQVTAILYGQLGTAAFKTLHGKLVELTAAGDVIYVYRHYLKAKDDTKVEGGDSGADEEEDAGVDVDGFVFSKLRLLLKTSVNSDMKREIEKNQQYFEQYHGMEAGDSALYVNGIPMDMEIYDVFMLLDIMKSEAKIMEGLFSLGFQFINDLETDKKYSNWPDKVQDILRPTYPGMLRHVAKNFFNLVFIVDPQEKDSRELLKMAESFYVHSVPVRIGVVFLVSGDKDVYETANGGEITVAMVTKEFKEQFADEEIEKVFGKDSEYDYVKRADLTQDSFEEGVITEIMQATPEFQQNVYQGRLHEGHNILEWVMEKDHVLPRLNSRVLNGPSKTLDLCENIDDSKVYALSLWLVVDLQTSEGRSLAYAALKRLKHSNDMRLAFIFNPEAPSTGKVDINKAAHVAVNTLSNTLAKSYVTKLVFGPLRVDEEFITEDVDLLEMYVKQLSANRLRTEITKMKYTGKKGSDLVMKVGGLLASIEKSHTRKKVKYGGDQHSIAAQKMAPILMVLKDLYNLDIRVYMNSKDKLSEMPLKRYYRYVLDPELKFKADGKLAGGPKAKFVDLPNKSILTLGMEPAENWLVEAIRAQYDLDNILLDEVRGGVEAEFQLEYLLLEGHCYDSNSGQPPRGLQFVLGTNSSDVKQDTIVMANLGYFQMKANPGAWTLKLRQGRSSELYDISSHEYTETPAGFKDVIVAMKDFKSRTIRVKVAKKPGKDKEKLLDDSKDEEGASGIWDTISSSFSGGEKSTEDKDQTLNIFSVASGHLYERLLRIMMMSVMKNTKSKVKFWFLKNYLSPTFKEFIPHYAKEYGFEYELVQYKWPRWLNQQKEKQRIMWGFKILFLDVLFPLDVKKFIFVDADQIVRTDLQELNDLDLGGAPYGYTPFCSDRKEMDGFRFWKSGYWAGHLAGRAYHISALYVVDLKRFREIAAGDRLRGQYQGLSQDPNSLSNLDQDLPNNMIHQEWLWCATWCSEESKKYAKTIDLVFWDSIYGTNTRSQIEYEPPELDSVKKEAWRDRIEL